MTRENTDCAAVPDVNVILTMGVIWLLKICWFDRKLPACSSWFDISSRVLRNVQELDPLCESIFESSSVGGGLA